MDGETEFTFNDLLVANESQIREALHVKKWSLDFIISI